MTRFLGTAVACIASIAVSLAHWDENYAPYLLAGGSLYLIGAVALTGGYHVPRNNELAEVDPRSADAERLWTRYLHAWTAGNHVRAAAALAAAALFIGAVNAS